MTVELVAVTDERGEMSYFVDFRLSGSLAASEWFPTETAAREFMAMGGKR